MKLEEGNHCLRITTPGAACRVLLQALDLHLPDMLPYRELAVVTREKLPERRIPH